MPAADGEPVECPVWCPICQVVHLVRAEHPDLAERLVETGTAFASALTAFADAALNPNEASEPARPRPAPRFERIDLTDDPEEF